MEIQKIEYLLEKTKELINRQQEIETLRGEKFNVFSILKMERKEVETHSAFLCELLKPEGSHLKGSVFLELFLQTIGNKSIDIETAKVTPEKDIGKKNELDKTGGRIDIYISDNKGNIITIENKIDASEQESQLERYCKHKEGKNTVYYLTKYGVPSEESKKLKVGEDYFLLSYKVDILNWLQACIKESFDAPILRETIKQYLILIKKITQTMNDKDQKELFDTILNNHDEASIIAANFKSAVLQLNNQVKERVFHSLEKELSEKYNVDLGTNQIWIKVSGEDEGKIYFGIESFAFEKSFHGENLFIGIFMEGGKYLDKYAILGERTKKTWWIEMKAFKVFNYFKDNTDYNVCFQDSKTLKKLYGDKEFQEKFVSHIVDETILYLNEHIKSVSEVLKDKSQ